MRRRGPGGGRRIGFVLAVIGAVMIVSLVLPLWFWWLIIGLAFLVGGLCILRK